jgi:hypothetical protein
MTSVQAWKKWILMQLWSVAGYTYMLEETLRAQASHHIDANFDIGLRELMNEGIITRIETEGKVQYGVPIPLSFDKLAKARQIVNSIAPVDESRQADVIQGFLPDPVGYEYWFTVPDNNPARMKKKSIYQIYRKKADSHSYVARILSRSDAEPKTINVGSMSVPESYISQAWHIFNELARISEDESVSLQELLNRNTDVFGSNKRRGKVILAIFLAEGWIEAVDKKGNEVRYKLTSNKTSNKLASPTLENFLSVNDADASKHASDFNETWNELDEPKIRTSENDADAAHSRQRKEGV